LPGAGSRRRRATSLSARLAWGVGVNLEDGQPDGSIASTDFHEQRLMRQKNRVPDLFMNARTDILGFCARTVVACRRSTVAHWLLVTRSLAIPDELLAHDS
jgi:hypothetical protein